MEQAKAEVARLHDSGEPFNLTLLTLDFHEPLHVADYCQVTTEEPLSSVLRCSNDQVAGFVDYMEEMGYLEDTAVVIMGDHPKMIAQGGAYASELSGVPLKERVLYNRIWSPDGVDLAREDIDQLSMYATILDLLNLGRGDHRAGLGVSALVEPPVGSALADLTAEQYGEMLRSRSGDFYRMLWGLGSADAVVAEADHD
jgi:phosphoglycerol transferase